MQMAEMTDCGEQKSVIVDHKTCLIYVQPQYYVLFDPGIQQI